VNEVIRIWNSVLSRSNCGYENVGIPAHRLGPVRPRKIIENASIITLDEQHHPTLGTSQGCIEQFPGDGRGLLGQHNEDGAEVTTLRLMDC
jgi:hypothetical protein